MRLSILAVGTLSLALTSFISGCGGDSGGGGDDGTGGKGSGGSGSGGKGGSGSGGKGGSGSGGTAGGEGGASGEITPAFMAANPCNSEAVYVTDMTTITTKGLKFIPACLRVKKGTKVTFKPDTGEFGDGVNASHALAPSDTRGDDNNPIPKNPSGPTVDVTFAKSGFFGYFCPTHNSSDNDVMNAMNGMVWVTE
jgi:plastocyanin